MTYKFETEINGKIFKFHKDNVPDKGELNTTLSLWTSNDPAIFDVTDRIGKEIPGIVSIAYKHKYRLEIERGNDLFPWEKLIEPLILFLCKEKNLQIKVDE